MSFWNKENLDEMRSQAQTRMLHSELELEAAKMVLSRIEKEIARRYLVDTLGLGSSSKGYSPCLLNFYSAGPCVVVVEDFEDIDWHSEIQICFRRFTKKGKLGQIRETLPFKYLHNFCKLPKTS